MLCRCVSLQCHCSFEDVRTLHLHVEPTGSATCLQAYERFGGLSGWRKLVGGQLDARLGLRAEHWSAAWGTLSPFLQVGSPTACMHALCMYLLTASTRVHVGCLSCDQHFWWQAEPWLLAHARPVSPPTVHAALPRAWRLGPSRSWRWRWRGGRGAPGCPAGTASPAARSMMAVVAAASDGSV